MFERFTTYRPGINHGYVTASHTLDPGGLTPSPHEAAGGRR
ncbi:hypothetical protein GFS60_03398 [Rhodococcus sp. WAY2]|nr:hypothetical protein GFS60_03398 [Rhodococcus sp. WAY2]